MTDLFVVDTHPLLFYAGDQLRKLGRKARQVFDHFEQGRATLFVPAPVVLETWLLARNGTIELETSLQSWWRRVSRPGLVQIDLSAEDIFAAERLDWRHRDFFDRLVVATARRLDCALVTK